MLANRCVMGLDVYASAAISGVLAGAAAILVTLAIEKFGGIVGGVLGSILLSFASNPF